MVRRIYVEKKPAYAISANDLKKEISTYLNIGTVTDVRVFNRYDVENVSDAVFETAKHTVFAEPPVDIVYEETLPEVQNSQVFSVEYLPGQFDLRADSAEQCIRMLDEREKPVVRSAVTYMIIGDVSGLAPDTAMPLTADAAGGAPSRNFPVR